MKLRSYAKINLALDIIRKRQDGYHDLETVFQQIRLYDELEIEKTNDNRIILECSVKDIENKNNTVYRAADFIIKRYNIDKGLRITIKKNIPIGGGLAGGSSNAAAVIKGMNHIFGLDMTQQDMIDIALEIGSDVPFHIIGQTAYAKGRGEQLKPIQNNKKVWVVLVNPGFEISTKEAFSDLDYNYIGQKGSAKKIAQDFNPSMMHNDFENSIIRKHPNITKIKKLLGKNALMSGSGSTVFKLFETKAEAEKKFNEIKEKYPDTFLTETINKKIIKAKEMGFCFGVKRAIDKSKEAARERKVYVFGELIHNRQVIEDLKQNNVFMTDDYNTVGKDSVIGITAHGIADNAVEEIKAAGYDVLDLTCPFVKRVHDIAKEEEKKGRKVIVFGTKDHVEVRGIVGNLKDYKVIKSADDLTENDLRKPITLISQTTRDTKKFNDLADQIRKKADDFELIDTICKASKDRQRSAVELSQESDIVIVIGGKNSSNTKRLHDICSANTRSYHIETEKELNSEWFFDKDIIGITAGASTPDRIINKVKDRIMLLY